MPLGTALMHNAREDEGEEGSAVVNKTLTPVKKPENAMSCEHCDTDIAKSEKTVRCNKCRGYYHAKCIGISKAMLKTVSRYPWDCPACKMCDVCDKPDGEESLMFCDICDRGYHTYCVNMSELPRGHWECRLCVTCSCCGTNVPGEGSWKFQHNEHMKFLQTMCYSCSVWWDKGWFCPACLTVFDYDATNLPMVCCDNCDRWVHTSCDDSITEERYKALTTESNLSYKCILCRGEKEEVYDKHHKKYRDGNKENRW